MSHPQTGLTTWGQTVGTFTPQLFPKPTAFAETGANCTMSRLKTGMSFEYLSIAPVKIAMGALVQRALTISQAQSDDKLQSLTCTRVMVKLC